MYIKKLFIVVLLTCLVAFVVGKIFDYRYRKRWSILFFEKTDQLIKDSAYFDIIYLGNSRVHFGINPFYVDSATGLRSYNFGMGGSDAKEMMLIGNIFLQNHKPPKVVVLSLDMSAFAPAYAIRTRFPYLFYLGNDTIYKYVQQEYASAPAMRILPFLKYSLFDEYNRTSLFTNGRPYPIFEHNIYRGFLNIHKGEALNGDVKFHIPPDDSLIVSRRAKLYLQTIITNFLTAGSKVIIISPPEKPTRPGRRNTLHQMRDSMVNIVSSGKKINYFHFRTSPQLENKYFTDDIHLNERGARIFSLLLADSIKSVL